MRTKLKIIGGGLLAMLITAVIVPIVQADERTALDVVEAAAFYHADVNDIVNERLMTLKVLMEELEDDPGSRERIQRRFEFVETDKCEETESLTVTCLKEEITKRKSRLAQDLSELPLPNFDSDELRATTAQQEQKLTLANHLETQANELMNHVLNAYGQILLANIMHTENLLTIAEIENLRDGLADLKTEATDLANNFINVSTTECR